MSDTGFEANVESTAQLPPPVSAWLTSLKGMPPRDSQNPEWMHVRELDVKHLSSLTSLTPGEATEYQQFSDRVVNSDLQTKLPEVIQAVLSPAYSAHSPAEFGDLYQEGDSDIEFTNKLQEAIRQGNPAALYLAAIVYHSALSAAYTEGLRLRNEGHEAGDLAKKDKGYTQQYASLDKLPVASDALAALGKKFNYTNPVDFKSKFTTASAVFAAPERVTPQPVVAVSTQQ